MVFSSPYQWAVFVLLAGLAVVSPFVDIALSRLLYENGAFALNQGFLNSFISLYLPICATGAAAVIFIFWLFDKVLKRPKPFVPTKVMLLTSGSMILGPGLVVNGVLKTFWDRARPVDLAIFGGSKKFSPPWVISDQCSWDCSFVSGHTAVAFWTISLALLTPQKYRATAVTAALLLGCLVGFGRMAQGAHFFSDVYFAGLITLAIVLSLNSRLGKKSLPPASQKNV